ncbi:hypothetical protein NKI95_04350 [Mesorhizobium sp. M0306]|uniref:hypothetical protein n=1 Tax=Mesorhizobium sp. M0306 TaxID=2956932 RepID=UPI0033367335
MNEARIFCRRRHILFLLCAGSYAINLGVVPIGAADPPTEAGFLFPAVRGSGVAEIDAGETEGAKERDLTVGSISEGPRTCSAIKKAREPCGSQAPIVE